MMARAATPRSLMALSTVLAVLVSLVTVAGWVAGADARAGDAGGAPWTSGKSWLSGAELAQQTAEFGRMRGESAAGKAARAFKYYSYAGVVAQLQQLEKHFPDLVEVFTAQDRYGLPSPGRCGSLPCLQHVVRITNERTLPDADRPEVFFSGELHGNEVVGPTTLIEFARLLTRSYDAASADHNPWLRRLVDTRAIYFMPTTNSQGYYAGRREENRIDPNRDFPIDKPGTCMQTIAARAVNELWREHLFQVSLTYHGGMQAIAYEWGTTTYHHTPVSPDDSAQLELGSAMSAFAGAFDEGRYPHNRLNDLVYPVRGGMEDWAYAASWLKDGTRPCAPKTFGGYAAERTRYKDDMLRAFNVLIECSTPKRPRESTLGSTAQLLRPEKGKGNGHVSRNLRLALLMTDIVQPYVEWVSAGGVAGSSNSSGAAGAVPQSFGWEVGGAMFVDSTWLEYTYALPGDGFATQHRGRSAPMHGKTRWTGGGRYKGNTTASAAARAGKDINLDEQDGIQDRERWPYVSAFATPIKLPAGARLLNVTALATVDQAWAKQSSTLKRVPANRPPQSHLVNARTLPSWRKENNGHKIVGRTLWSSKTIVFSPPPGKDGPENSAEKQPEQHSRSGGLEPAAVAPAPTQVPTGRPTDMAAAPEVTAAPEQHAGSGAIPNDGENSADGAAAMYSVFLLLTGTCGLVFVIKLLRLSGSDYELAAQDDMEEDMRLRASSAAY